MTPESIRIRCGTSFSLSVLEVDAVARDVLASWEPGGRRAGARWGRASAGGEETRAPAGS